MQIPGGRRLECPRNLHVLLRPHAALEARRSALQHAPDGLRLPVVHLIPEPAEETGLEQDEADAPLGVVLRVEDRLDEVGEPVGHVVGALRLLRGGIV